MSPEALSSSRSRRARWAFPRGLKRAIRRLAMALSNLLFAPSANKSTYPLAARIPDAEVLVVMLTHLGDCVIHQPLLAGLLSLRKGGKPVHLLIKSGVEDLFSSCPQLIVRPFRSPWVGAGNWMAVLGDWVRLIAALRKFHFDIVIVTHPHFLTSLTARLVGARCIVGFAEAGDRLLDVNLPDVPSIGSVGDRRDSLMRRLGIPGASQKPWPYYEVARVDRGATLARAVFESRRAAHGEDKAVMEYLCIHPGAGGARKVWPWMNFVELIEQTPATEGLPIVLVGGASEIEACAKIEKALSGKRVVENLAGRLGVQELFGAIRAATVYVGNDSGPSHLAASSGVPALVIFGPNSILDLWKPEGAHVDAIALPPETFWEKRSVPAVAASLQAMLNSARAYRSEYGH